MRMPRPLHEYTLPYRCAILIGLSFVFMVLGAAIDWVCGEPLLDSPGSLSFALIFPIVLLAMAGSGESDVARRREQFALTCFVFCTYLLLLAALIYLIGFPAPHKLYKMPIMTSLLVFPWAAWNYRSAKNMTSA